MPLTSAIRCVSLQDVPFLLLVASFLAFSRSEVTLVLRKASRFSNVSRTSRSRFSVSVAVGADFACLKSPNIAFDCVSLKGSRRRVSIQNQKRPVCRLRWCLCFSLWDCTQKLLTLQRTIRPKVRIKEAAEACNESLNQNSSPTREIQCRLKGRFRVFSRRISHLIPHGKRIQTYLHGSSYVLLLPSIENPSIPMQSTKK